MNAILEMLNGKKSILGVLAVGVLTWLMMDDPDMAAKLTGWMVVAKTLLGVGLVDKAAKLTVAIGGEK